MSNSNDLTAAPCRFVTTRLERYTREVNFRGNKSFSELDPERFFDARESLSVVLRTISGKPHGKIFAEKASPNDREGTEKPTKGTTKIV